MPRRRLSEMTLWEQRLAGTVAKWPGWSVVRDRDRIMVRLRPKDRPAESVTLPRPLVWDEASEGDATLWIRQLYKAWDGGEQTLKAALDEIGGTSDKQADQFVKTWPDLAEDFRESLMKGRNQIRMETWRDNYLPYIGEALRLLSSRSKPKDGYGLLKASLRRWEGKPSSRAACCLALRNWMDFSVSRHGAPHSWRISKTDIAELRGRPPQKRVKAVLTDLEILELIEALDARNHGWANVVRVLAATGLRPIELQHISTRPRPDGTIGLWCGHRKTAGPNKCEPRWLEECPLEADGGEMLSFGLAEALHKGELDWPIGRDGNPRKLSGHYVEQYLREQPEWRALKAKCEARGEWLRSYSFRDSFSARAHRLGVETAQICRALGHGLAAHSRAYRTATDASTSAAFAAIKR
jgi:integrase